MNPDWLTIFVFTFTITLVIGMLVVAVYEKVYSISKEEIEKMKKDGLEQLKNFTKVCGLHQEKKIGYFAANPYWCFDT